MLLKRVEIFGFKSFAEKSRIDLNEGVTALLGPNGCGKSNVVDAIKWVLGEQATRSLRAEKMEDVIFNGTEHRKALNVAEVTLTLSNEAGVLGLDYPEIEIRRRLYRSGESEYFINNTPVRLKELRELFFDTGVGKSAYSIMEQGKIDQILSNKPEERRYIFEEAAGITKFKVRGQEAERKLEKTEENVRQVEGILGEVKRSHDTLKAQAQKTVVYRQYRQEIFELEKTLQLLKLRQQQQEKEELEGRLRDTRDELKKVQDEIDGINKSMESNLDLVNSMEGELIQIQKKLYSLDLEKNNVDAQMKILRDRLSYLDEQKAGVQHKYLATGEKQEALIQEIAQKQGDLEKLKSDAEQVLLNIRDFETQIQAAQERIQLNMDCIQKNDVRVLELEKKQEDNSASLRQLTEDIVTELDRRLDENSLSWEEGQKLEESLAHDLENLRILLQGRRDLLGDLIRGGGDPQGLESSLQGLEEALEILGRFRQDWERYKAFTPSLLQDFLSPKGILTRKREIEQNLEENHREIQELRQDTENRREENLGLDQKKEEYRRTLEELKVNQATVNAQIQSLDETIKRLNLDSAQLELQKTELLRDMEAMDQKKGEFLGDIQGLQEKFQVIEKQEKDWSQTLKGLETGIAEKNSDLQSKEKNLKEKLLSQNDIHRKLEQVQMHLAQCSTEIRNIYENFRDKHSVDLRDHEEQLPPDLPGTKELKEKLQQRREDLRALGQVNLMAPEEFSEVEERYNFLTGQLDDLRQAREDLRKVTLEIQRESAKLFQETYNEVRKNFHSLFRQLFGGGRAELRLTDPENILESGIEMYCQPPGKKLENIALLSGGERSLTAVALLFATYMVKPSPFCILDEIDAALDEANVGRFVNMLVEFSRNSQFIIITHNKKTVAGASTLVGVTMEESGISKVIGIRIGRPGEEGEPLLKKDVPSLDENPVREEAES